MKQINFKQTFINIMRRLFWKLGRRIYMRARNESRNNIESNGEKRLQREILEAIRNCSNDPVIFDVGANIGDWTLSLIKQSQKISGINKLNIHVFEPFPSTFNTLSERLQNYVDSNIVQCNNIALSSEISNAYMFGKTNAGTSTIHPGIDASNFEKVQIKKMTIDAYCTENSINEVNFIKCDTEGHDFEVIRGALNTLRNGNLWILQFEYNHRWIYSRHYLKDVFDLIKELPYSVAKVAPNGLELYEQWHPELDRFFEGNYALIKNGLEKKISCKTIYLDSSSTFA